MAPNPTITGGVMVTSESPVKKDAGRPPAPPKTPGHGAANPNNPLKKKRQLGSAYADENSMIASSPMRAMPSSNKKKAKAKAHARPADSSQYGLAILGSPPAKQVAGVAGTTRGRGDELAGHSPHVFVNDTSYSSSEEFNPGSRAGHLGTISQPPSKVLHDKYLVHTLPPQPRRLSLDDDDENDNDNDAAEEEEEAKAGHQQHKEQHKEQQQQQQQEALVHHDQHNASGASDDSVMQACTTFFSPVFALFGAHGDGREDESSHSAGGGSKLRLSQGSTRSSLGGGGHNRSNSSDLMAALRLEEDKDKEAQQEEESKADVADVVHGAINAATALMPAQVAARAAAEAAETMSYVYRQHQALAAEYEKEQQMAAAAEHQRRVDEHYQYQYYQQLEQHQQQQQQQQQQDEEEEEEEEVQFDPYMFIANLPPRQEAEPCGEVCLPRKIRAAPRVSLVLDLDETLVHCSTEPLEDACMTFPVLFNNNEYTVYVRQRPHLLEFLERVAPMFEIIVFTASQQAYADTLLSLLDPEHKYFRHRVFRDSCINVDGNYLKDLNVLGRELHSTVIIDNSPQAFGYQLENGIPIESWFSDADDSELLGLLPFLEKLQHAEDVRPLVEQEFKLKDKVQYYVDHPEENLLNQTCDDEE